ncbi:MAG: hypothetical protein WDM86_12810 [Rhizomicrobium sp.]
MNKYDRLGAFLREQGRESVPMTFAEIEQVVGVKLPKSRMYQAWWSNSTSNNVMTRVWLDAGYRTEQVDVAHGRLVFRRVASGGGAQRSTGMREETPMFRTEVQTAPSGGKLTRHPASGALKGMVTIEPGYDIASSDPEDVAEWEAAADRTADLVDAGMKRRP